MISSKKNYLKHLIDSSSGIHLTAYLVNQGDIADLKNQLHKTLDQYYETLTGSMPSEELNKFLAPISSLLSDSRIFREMKGNIGIYRNKNFFKILNVPVRVDHTTHIATSFHVKPILRWLQGDQDFLFLSIDKSSASLYLGSQESLKLIDSVLLPDTFKKYIQETSLLKVDSKAFFWINDWLSELTKSFSPKLFIAGEEQLVKNLSRSLNYKNVIKTTVVKKFNHKILSDIAASIRKNLKDESFDDIEKKIAEFTFVEGRNRALKNIFEITQAVVRGQVRKLIITDEVNIFGKINKEDGRLFVHPYDLDHEDDDILDDLAQMVLGQGGEVIIASMADIPQGRPVLAIIDDDGVELEKTIHLTKWGQYENEASIRTH